MAMTLFPDQQHALDAVLDVYHKQPIGYALVQAPTGWGKTIFFSFLARALKGVNVLIIAHRDELLNQARDKILLVDPGAHVGKVGGGVYEWGAPITVAGVDTISQPRHLKNLHKFGYGLVIWDECHHARAAGYERVRAVLPNAFHLGVTATPYRLDGKSLEPLFGKPIFEMDIKEAITLGRICNVKARAIQTNVDLSTVKTAKNSDGDADFNQEELELAVDTSDRNTLIVRKYQEYASGRPAVAFCVTIAHAQKLAAAFNQVGIPSAMITGDTSTSERAQIFQAYRTGKMKVLTNVEVLSEGWDEPLAEVAIMARPTQSNSLYVQCIGRVLRLRKDEHKEALILDITDNSLRLRLSPANFRRAVGIEVRNDELITDALQREEEERPARVAAEKQALIHKLNDNRDKDVVLDLFALPAWEERPGGLYVMNGVGSHMHRIALVPCKGDSGLYDVWARLAPHFRGQKWASVLSLDEAREFADKRANLLIADEATVKLLDKSKWANDPITEGQKKMLNWYKIPWGENMTKGQASDLIDTHKREIERKKRAKAERAAKKARKEQVSA